MEKVKKENNPTDCTKCLYYEYDEESGEDFCTLSLDEDEYVAFMNRKSVGCPYYREYDEYSTVRKQNELPDSRK